jgi:signal transduction histidine kinase
VVTAAGRSQNAYRRCVPARRRPTDGPERAEALFEPFRQASEGLSRKFEGSGVGLAVTKKAVEQMDGRVDVETEKGKGSRFVARLPCCEKNGARRDVAAPSGQG